MANNSALDFLGGVYNYNKNKITGKSTTVPTVNTPVVNNPAPIAAPVVTPVANTPQPQNNVVYGPPVPDSLYANKTTTPTIKTSSNTSQVQNYLDTITKQFGNLSNSYVSSKNQTLANAAGQAAKLKGNYTSGIKAIDSSTADYTKAANKNIINTNQSAGQAQYETKKSLRNNFSARGALDSTFYDRALQGGQLDIKTQQDETINYINEELDKAKKEATKQKNLLKNNYYTMLDTLEKKKQEALKSAEDQYNNGTISLQQMQIQLDKDPTQFASASELDRLTNIKNEVFNIDNYITQIDTAAKNTVGKINALKSKEVNSNIQASNIGDLLSKLSTGLKAGMTKADFVPILTSQGYSPEDAQSILDKAEIYKEQLAGV